ncbi:NUDIX domain-containing protein [Streptomyces sp. N2-109]|uniref:NUDIX domain-containing protein n=1 Tax=Streptomyces gossypii TaxID=2883101 RepID=A0ABT2JR03_9ACTN|nr:NUDIX domain-containing protein [Streptomyces gossypii]MCT2589795.1 NUDIX domain-containing protein [Streptomyces gossypii]
MPITANHIRTTITAYLDQHPEDKREIDIVQGLLDDGDDLTSRKFLPGHVTAGAILVGRDGRVLHILHNATGKWLLPGGHIEHSDDTLLQAAGRELAEETGIPPYVVTPHNEIPCTSTSTPSTPIPPRTSPPTSTSTSASSSVPPPTSANCRPKRSPTPRGARWIASPTSS